jgi:translation initiation factor IF-2
MAKKRVHEIAKEQGLQSKDVLAKLQAAGLEVKAAASSVDEAEALRALKANGGAKAATAPADGAAATQSRPAAPPRPESPQARSGQGTAGAAAGPAGRSDQARPGGPQGRAGAPGQTRPGGPQGRAGAPRRPPGVIPSGAANDPNRPAPGTGPRILSMPEPPPRPQRDEPTPADKAAASGEQTRQRPTRSSIQGERAPGGAAAGARRRVVIDSQASRRAPAGGPAQSQQPQRRPARRGRRRRDVLEEQAAPLDVGARTRTDVIRVASGSTVKDIAEYLGVPVPEVIKKLMGLGEMATLTQTLSDETIQVLASEFDHEIEIVRAADDADVEPVFDDEDTDLVARPPVVTIMGHVDHGKTSLLDAIRQTEVAQGEAGGITQHIGAYQVHHGDNVVTFLDTPGHEAFTAMRARGAKVTDIAVIVVAADDGAKPQTDEAIDHAKAAGVPMVVAVNKIDKEGADPTRVRTEMTTRGLQPSEWGGDIEFVDVSAKAKLGLEDLLDTILVVAELEELKANPNAEASGVVIESKLDPGRGPVVTVLIQRGTLKVGDSLVAGSTWGKVRAMSDYKGERRKVALPGEPVEVLGFDGVPDAGDLVRVVGERATRLKTEALARRSGRKISLEDVFKRAQEGEVKELNLVLKADVSGSLEAFEDEIAKLPQDEVQVNILRSGVGGINESDVMLAAASDAVILGFNVRPVGDARHAAEHESIEVRLYAVIYKAIDDLRLAMQGLLAPEEVEDIVGQVEVRQVFRASRIGTIAGSYVTEGKVTRGAKVRIVRDGTVIYDTRIGSLRRFNEDAREVSAGYECGIVLENFADVKEGDVFEVYSTRQVERTLA